MGKFITGKDLEKTIYDIIWESEKFLLIVSPYIKLGDYFKSLFIKHINNPHLHIVIVFGKNEDDISRSLTRNDFGFFKQFLNISIIYVPHLHAKYYANEKKGVVTSINLYDYSFKNNIEFGIYEETNFLSSLRSTPDSDAWNACYDIATTNESIFIKRPVFDKKVLSSIFGKKYIKSDTLYDITENFYTRSRVEFNLGKRLNDFPDELILGADAALRPEREERKVPKKGFCIRTGIEIPYNPNKPFCDSSFRTWSQFKNFDYPEKYCHRTGRQSYGKTSFQNPILTNW